MDSCSNSQTTKRSLTASLGCIALCVVLLIGTTFAWFTDTATTSVSKVQAGTLDVQLVDKDGKSVEGQTLQFQKAEGGSTQAVLWEPGCTYELPAVYVKNNGNLALKYKLQITGINGDDKLNSAIEWTITDSTTGQTTELDADHSLAAGATSSGALTIKGHMKEDAGNEYQGLSIDGVSITVVATQDTVEYDSTTSTYDEKATYAIPVSTTDALKTAIANGEDVRLTADVDLPAALEVTSDVTIYGDGTKQLKWTGSESSGRVINVNDATDPVTLTLSGVNIVGPTDNSENRGISVYGNSDITIVMDNCSASANHYALNIAGGNEKVNVTVRNSTLTGYAAFQTWSANTKATFENCTLTGLNQWSSTGQNDYAAIVIAEGASGSELTFTNCRIESKMTDTAQEAFLFAWGANSNVTFDGCTFFITQNGSTTELASTDEVAKWIGADDTASITIK